MTPKHDVTPIFILSLPRSGSTLLQRLLAVRDEVASAPEPWLLLPFLAALRPEGIYADYSHLHQHEALLEFFSELPGGESDYLAGVRKMALHVYGEAAGPDSHYFLDKTPRYHLICRELFQTFPDAKFIFLWRHPFGIISSMIDTWGNGRWNLSNYHVDLFEGLRNLVEAYRTYGDRSLAIRFEDLVVDKERVLRQVFDYLDLGPKSDGTPLPHPGWAGRKGDPTGIHKYSSVNEEPVDKWRGMICNPFRKKWCSNYLDWIGERDLAVMGYELASMKEALSNVKVGRQYLASDLAHDLYGRIRVFLEPHLLKRKFKRIARRDTLVERR